MKLPKTVYLMSKPKISLSDKLQEAIAFNQEDNCEMAKSHVRFIDGLMSTIIHGHPIIVNTEHERLEMLQKLLMIKQDYESFIVE